MGSRRGHTRSGSLQGIRTSVAMVMSTPFSPGRDLNRPVDYSSRLRSPKRANACSIIPRRDSGFESQEPSSPEISCIGQIKLKQKWSKASKRGEKGSKDRKLLSKLKNLLFRRCIKKAEEAPAMEEEEEETFYPSLGQIKRYISGSYDGKFGDMFAEEEPTLADSQWLVLNGNSNAGENGGEGEEAPGICMEKQLCIPAIKALDVNNLSRFELQKPFST
ncbi:hypothetical protein SUGI_1004290 [Cryptomeria japonica]|uniref:uncharacterized protein At1g76070-like n=1 Tax=Cryptomeria japonica TaxID=3369 RepID=UPI00241490C4|nr:uncharacterized protein At1g76070-like [Cryptomeria japonica]GLJ47553.1 hypothetical protein SUGI_1004290 [Cryptomeria japonica]